MWVDNLKIKENISLRQYTSMYVGGDARYFFELQSVESLPELVNFSNSTKLPIFILGGGSNIIVSDKGFDGLVIKNEILGIERTFEDNQEVLFKVGAGEYWDDLVDFCVDSGLYGLENLSHIPGTVGASVVQNIGAYGAEVSSSVDSVDVFDIRDLVFKNLKKGELKFSYRKSILNDPKESRGRYVVTYVNLRLKKNSDLNIKYDDLKNFFLERPDLEVNLKNLRQAVIDVRNKKFPYPDKPENGTVGSFWNAETVSEKTFDEIAQKLDKMGFSTKAEEMKSKKSVFRVTQGYKVPYGVLVEVLGFKGKVFDKAKILETHSCVINNFSGESSAREIIDISDQVLEKVYKEFGVSLKVEPELVGDFN